MKCLYIITPKLIKNKANNKKHVIYKFYNMQLQKEMKSNPK